MNKKNSIKKRPARAGAAAGNGAGNSEAALTHENRIKTALEELKPNITRGDRRALQQHLDLTNSTISKYLAGRVMSVETGLDILQYLTSRIKEREDRLKTLSV